MEGEQQSSEPVGELGRISSLLIFPGAVLAIVAVFAWLSERAQRGSTGYRYHTEYLILLVLAPSVVIYFLAMPFVWRIARRASTRSVAAFSALTFLLTIGGLLFALGPLYRAIGRIDPTLADRAIFTVLPCLPIFVAIGVSLVVLRKAASRHQALFGT